MSRHCLHITDPEASGNFILLSGQSLIREGQRQGCDARLLFIYAKDFFEDFTTLLTLSTLMRGGCGYLHCPQCGRAVFYL